MAKLLADSHFGTREDTAAGNPDGWHLVFKVAAVGAKKHEPRELIIPSTTAPIQIR